MYTLKGNFLKLKVILELYSLGCYILTEAIAPGFMSGNKCWKWGMENKG